MKLNIKNAIILGVMLQKFWQKGFLKLNIENAKIILAFWTTNFDLILYLSGLNMMEGISPSGPPMLPIQH